MQHQPNISCQDSYELTELACRQKLLAGPMAQECPNNAALIQQCVTAQIQASVFCFEATCFCRTKENMESNAHATMS